MRCAEARLLLSRRLDSALEPAQAGALETHLASCSPCRTVAQAFQAEQAALADLWPVVAAPPGFAEQVLAALPARPAPRAATVRASQRRCWLAAVAALLVLLLGGSVMAQPDAWAGLGLFLRRVVLHETASTEPTRELPVGQVTLQEAQRLVPWHILQPTDLPEGYRLVAVEADELHAFAVGPTIVLHYQRTDGAPAQEVSLVELQAASEVSEPVAPGAAHEVPVGDTGTTGLFIDGRWVERGGEQVWERGTLVRLIVERGDLVMQLQADPRDGWDAGGLGRLAASLR
jgi:hypothetical protein